MRANEAEFYDYYAFIGVSRLTSHDEIRNAIMKMYRKWHPDICSHKDAHETTVRIGEAKEILLDEAKRAIYDSEWSRYNRATHHHHQTYYGSTSSTSSGSNKTNNESASSSTAQHGESKTRSNHSYSSKIEFFDYYKFLRVTHRSSRVEIHEAIDVMHCVWNPKYSSHPKAHENYRRVEQAKEILLDDWKKAAYDLEWNRRNPGTEESTAYSGSSSSQSKHYQASTTWEHTQSAAREEAIKEAEGSLDDLLEKLGNAATKAGNYVWRGTTSNRLADDGPDLGTILWSGVGVWACIVCLLVPGTSIVTFFMFKFAFFPPPSGKFIGFENMMKGTVYILAIVVVLVLIIFATR
jgi:DnaJ-class molecular chaperone